MSWNDMIHFAAPKTCNLLLLIVPKNKQTREHSHSVTFLFTVWPTPALSFVYKCCFGVMPRQAIGPMPPFSLHLPQTSSLQCQAGLEQTERFSLASHQLPQRRVKQAVAGLAVPSTTILLSHMGIVCTVQDDTGSAGSACHGLTREVQKTE